MRGNFFLLVVYAYLLSFTFAYVQTLMDPCRMLILWDILRAQLPFLSEGIS